MVTNDLIPPEKQRNPITREAHRRQAFWQIYFPLILFGSFVLIGIVMAVLLDSQGASKWADISLVAFLITLVVIIVSIVYTAKLIKATPYSFFIVQRYAFMIEMRVKRASNVAVEPFLRIHSFIAGARAIRKK